MTAPLALVCGAGQFPLAVASAVTASGRDVFLIGIRGAADPAIERFPHGWIGMGRLGRLLDLAKTAGAKEVTFVGAVTRPSRGFDFIPDLRFLKLMLRLLGSGDNRMLTGLADEVAKEGLIVRGVHEIAPGLMLPAGPLGKHQPSAQASAAAELGFRALDALGPFDIGQSAVVVDKRVVAIEGAEGTDLMLERVAALQASGRLKADPVRSVFVKSAKRSQDLRLDTPAIGIETVQRVRRAGLGGLAISAGEVMTPDIAALISSADESGLFMVGVERKP